MALKQASRLLNLGTPLGADVLLLTSFTGAEGISQLFRFSLEMISDNAGIAAKDILGKNVTFSIRLANDSPRFFNGYVSRFAAGDEDQNGRRGYRAEVVPWLWFLTRNSDCRIFQKMTAPEIIQQIFKDRGFSDFQLKLTGSHPKREYCVQHRETDFNFVSRLMEEEGIFYFFDHKNGKHQMVLADKATAYVDCPQKHVDYPTDWGTIALEDHIQSWEHAYEFRTGRQAQTDYNFETPSTNLGTQAKTVVKIPGNDGFEYFDYPGIYINKGDGQPLSDVRMEEVEADHDVVEGTSICRSFSPGAKFKIRQHRASSEQGKSFVVTRLNHTAHEIMSYETGEIPGEGYENTFTCIPDSATFRPPRATPKPRVQGVQTAIVVGPSGEEIYPDKYGRVKVQFHWDRYGKRDENSSCWIRVSQVHAGKGFGGIDLPRIGDEVIVGFPDGDPDRPIITGRLYHAENMPPFGLPGSKTISGMKTKTYKGGGYNEMVMDDSPGAELIRVHGQFDMDSTIENDLREHVLHDRSRDVTNNETIQVGVDRTETVGNNETLSVGVNQTQSIGVNRSETVGVNKTESVGSNKTVSIGMMQNETVGIMYNEMVGVAKTSSIGVAYALTVGAVMNTAVGIASFEEVGVTKMLTVGGGLSETIGGDRQEKVGKNFKVTVGADSALSVTGKHVEKAKEITLSATEKLTIMCGSSLIIMEPAMITIKAPLVKINC